VIGKKSAGKESSFLARVRAALPGLNPAQRRLAEFVCDFPGEIASYTGSELAELAHVSKATVSRFFKELGYETYEQARRHARAEKHTGSRLFLNKVTGDQAGKSLSIHLAQAITNLEDTFFSLSDRQIDGLSQTLLKARKVWVVGFRSSHAFASYLQWQLTQVIENIVVIPAGGQTMGEYLASIKPQDVVIVFGLRRRISSMDTMLALIHKSKAKTAYITDEGVPFNREVAWHFRCHTVSSGPLFNHVAVAGLCHLVTNRTIELAGKQGRTRLRDIEALNDSLGEL
jgi:DNA-binding MurR/RpiR family transcriptional regulator